MGDHFRFKPTALYITLGQGNPKKLKPKRYMNPFLCFAHEERKKSRGGHLLSDWKAAHKGLGGKWRGMDKANKAKYVSASKQLKGSYDQQMNLYRKKRQELVKSIRIARLAQRASKNQRKLQKVHAKKVKAAGHKASKGKRSSRKLKKAKTTLKKKGKKSKAVKRKHGQIARDNKNVVPRKINARIRVTRITSRVVPN